MRPYRIALGSAAALAALALAPAHAADATPSVPLTERQLLGMPRGLAPDEQARLDWIRHHPRPRRLLARVLPTPPADYMPRPINEAADPHMCQVEYNPDRALKVHAMIGDTVVFQFHEGETIPATGGGFFSDTVSLQRASAANMVFLKAMRPMSEQPIELRLLKPDGGQHLYVLEWSTGDRECYSIKYRYTAEDAAAKRAERATQEAGLNARAAERALAPGVVAPPGVLPMPVLAPPPGANTNYQIRGNAGLLQVQGSAPR